MKSIISKAMMLVTISTMLLSFSPGSGNPAATRGGEGFEISMNNKILVQRFGHDMDNPCNLQLNTAFANDQLIIKYHHCGRVGKNRIITIRNGENNKLKEFRYADGTPPVSGMSLPVKELLELKKNNPVLKMYYTSTELPNGRFLTSFN